VSQSGYYQPGTSLTLVCMTHTTFPKIRLLSLPAVVFLTLPLFAANEKKVHWNDVCRAAEGNSITVKTSTGETVDGYCMSINVDEMAVRTKSQQVVRIARKTLSRIDVARPQDEGHQLRALGRNMNQGLHTGFKWLFSPRAPLGIVAIPATLVYGAVATPFCILGDLTQDSTSTTVEIKVI
jgi:hypothetical protein